MRAFLSVQKVYDRVNFSNTGSQELAYFTLNGLSLTFFHCFLDVSANRYVLSFFK